MCPIETWVETTTFEDRLQEVVPAVPKKIFESKASDPPLDVSRDRYREDHQVLPQAMSASGPSEKAKAEYRQYVIDAAIKGTSPSESALRGSLALLGKTIDDLRKDVGELRSFFGQHGFSAMPTTESEFRFSANPIREGELKAGQLSKGY
jgi:hypothetical protein